MSAPRHYLSGKTPVEKSRFVQACNRLSLFLKEKGNIRDLNFGIKDAIAVSPTVDLLSNIDKPGDHEKEADKSVNNNLPQYYILDTFENCRNKASSSKPVKTTQMTIFYEGQVLVIDDVPADRTRDLILMAKKGRPNDNHVELASTSESPSSQAEVEADLPIARRASLHKFLAKRKDRSTLRAPYQVQNQSPGGKEHTFDLNL